MAFLVMFVIQSFCLLQLLQGSSSAKRSTYAFIDSDIPFFVH